MKRYLLISFVIFAFLFTTSLVSKASLPPEDVVTITNNGIPLKDTELEYLKFSGEWSLCRDSTCNLETYYSDQREFLDFRIGGESYRFENPEKRSNSKTILYSFSQKFSTVARPTFGCGPKKLRYINFDIATGEVFMPKIGTMDGDKQKIYSNFFIGTVSFFMSYFPIIVILLGVFFVLMFIFKFVRKRILN